MTGDETTAMGQALAAGLQDGLAAGLAEMDGSRSLAWIAASQATGTTLTDLAAGVTAMAEACERARLLALPTVYEALARIKAELPGIGKSDRSPEGYDYRGIEAIARHLQALEGRHGVMVVPNMIVRSAAQVPTMKEGWTDTVVDVEWTITGPRGDVFYIPPDEPGGIERLPMTHGVGRDKTDKGAAKALTQARKQLLIALYQIGDGNDDPDSDKAPADTEYRAAGSRASGQQPAAQPEFIPREQYLALTGRAKKLTEAQREALRAEWTHEDPMTGDPMFPVTDDGRPNFGAITTDILPGVEAMLTRHERAAATPPSSPPPGPEGVATPADTPQAAAAPQEAAQPATPPAEDDAPASQALTSPAADVRPWETMAFLWGRIIEAMNETPADELAEVIRSHQAEPVSDDPQEMRSQLAALEADAAGLPPYGVMFDGTTPLGPPDWWAPGIPITDRRDPFEAVADGAEAAGDRSTDAAD